MKKLSIILLTIFALLSINLPTSFAQTSTSSSTGEGLLIQSLRNGKNEVNIKNAQIISVAQEQIQCITTPCVQPATVTFKIFGITMQAKINPSSQVLTRDRRVMSTSDLAAGHIINIYGFFDTNSQSISVEIIRDLTKRILSNSNTSNGKVCIQVITPAKNPQTGETKTFPTPCDVPAGWIKI